MRQDQITGEMKELAEQRLDAIERYMADESEADNGEAVLSYSFWIEAARQQRPYGIITYRG